MIAETEALVSVIIPAFNAEEYISSAIESVLLQQNIKKEIIVVDDGSTDRTSEIVKGFGSKVKLIRQGNQGVSSARNRGIKESCGDFIAFLDADDTWFPEKLAKQLSLFSMDTAIGTVICDERHVTSEGELVKESFFKTRNFSEKMPSAPGRLRKAVSWLVEEPFFPTSSVVTRRRILEKAGLFDESLSIVEDRDMWLRLSFLAPVGVVPEVLVTYLTGRDSSLASSVSTLDWAKAVEKVLLRHQIEIERCVKAEGEDVDMLLGKIFWRIGEACWYGEDYPSAANAYERSMRKGTFGGFLKWLTSKLGMAGVLRGIKQRLLL